jgi:hypothetical protein
MLNHHPNNNINKELKKIPEFPPKKKTIDDKTTDEEISLIMLFHNIHITKISDNHRITYRNRNNSKLKYGKVLTLSANVYDWYMHSVIEQMGLVMINVKPNINDPTMLDIQVQINDNKKNDDDWCINTYSR